MSLYQGSYIVKGYKFAIIMSKFNEFFSKELVESAKDTLIRHGAKEDDIDIYIVPGAFEIPFTAKKLVKTNKYDAIICLGVVIRGDTPHFDYISAEVSKGIANVSLSSEIPVIFGVLTVDSLEQAMERSGTKAGNKGKDAALAAIEMVNLFKINDL